jgi:hypothetical protein
VDYREDAYSAAEGADALVLVTEWNLCNLELAKIKELMRRRFCWTCAMSMNRIELRLLGLRIMAWAGADKVEHGKNTA